jgi:hypothetical protein
MTRCSFRKPQRSLKLTQGLAVITIMLGAELCLELQTALNPDQSTAKATPLLGESVTIHSWILNSWNSLLR